MQQEARSVFIRPGSEHGARRKHCGGEILHAADMGDVVIRQRPEHQRRSTGDACVVATARVETLYDAV